MGIGIGGGGVAAGAIRAGLAVVELGVNNAPLVAGLEEARARLGTWAGSIAKLGAVASAAGASILGPLLALMKGAIDRDKAAGGMAGMLGTTAEQASRLAYAFSTVGIEQESVQHFLRHLSKSIADAGDDIKEAQDKFTRLGLAWQDLAGMDMAGLLAAVGDAVGRIADPARRSAVAIEFFGRSGMDALKLFRGGGGELTKRMEEAGLVGAVVTDAQAKQAKEVMRAWNRMGAAIHNAWLEVGRALIPASAVVEQWTGYVVEAARWVREWVAANQPLVKGLATVGTALAAAGSALLAVAGAMKLFSLGMGLVGSVVGAQIRTLALLAAALLFLNNPIALAVVSFTKLFSLGWGLASSAVMFLVRTLGILLGALMLLNSPVGVIVAAVASLTAVWLIATDSGKATAKALGDAFGEIKETFTLAWGGVMKALKEGDLARAGKIAMTGLDVAWTQGITTLKDLWRGFCEFFIRIWETITTAALKLWGRIISGFRLGFARITMAGDEWKKARDQILDEEEVAESEREADIREARRTREIEAAHAGFRDLMAKKAAEQRLRDLLAGPTPEPGPMPHEVVDEAKLRQIDLSGSVKGLFSAPNYAQALGLGDKIGKKQYEMMKDVRDEVKKVVAKLDKMDVVFG